MPKIYSEEERRDIVNRLKAEANILMLEKGVKKTTVDELVKRAGIPKGTFYLFYPSKEMLLFDCAQDFHEEVDEYVSQGLTRIMERQNPKTNKSSDSTEYIDEVVDVIMGAVEITQNSCLRVLLEPESMNLVLSKLPEDVLEKHRQEDSNRGEKIIEAFAAKNGISVEELSGAFTMILFGTMYKQVVGENVIEGSTRLLVRGLVKQLFEGIR